MRITNIKLLSFRMKLRAELKKQPIEYLKATLEEVKKELEKR